MINIDKPLNNHASISIGEGQPPIEITIVGKFPAGSAKDFFDSAFKQQAMHPEYVDEYNEVSAPIGKPTFKDKQSNTSHSVIDPTATYTFGVDIRDLVFHRHAGHRVIIGISGEKGCILKFSLCTPEQAKISPLSFLKQLHIVNIPGNRMFCLRFNGTVYHQFTPVDYNERACFAVSTHTNEVAGLSGKLLKKVLAQEGSIALLTEPAPTRVLELLTEPDAYRFAVSIHLDCE